MSDQTPNLTQLLGSIPQIIITEPSPLIRNIVAESGTRGAADASTAIPIDAAKSTQMPTAGETGVAVSGDSKQDSDEFVDPDSSLNEESNEQPAQVVVEVDGGAPQETSERERNEESEDDFRDLSVESRFGRFMRALAYFNDSKYMLIIQFLLLVIPISAGFMGAKYLDKCPLSSETPVFLFMMGIAGTIVIICRILLLSQRIMLPTHLEWQVLRVVIIVGNLAIIVCLATEMFSFYRTPPSFELGSAHYCHQRFYKYTYWTNWTCLIVITFLMLLQLPNCSVVTSQSDSIP